MMHRNALKHIYLLHEKLHCTFSHTAAADMTTVAYKFQNHIIEDERVASVCELLAHLLNAMQFTLQLLDVLSVRIE